MPPDESDTATIRAPSSASSTADVAPALPKPWTTTREPGSGIPRCLAADSMQ